MKIRLLFLSSGLTVGGAEKFLVSLINSIDTPKYEIKLVVFNNYNPLINDISPNIETIILPRKDRFDFGPVFSLRRILKKYNPNWTINIGLFPNFLLTVATVFLKLNGRNLISYHTTVQRSKKDEFLAKLYFLLLKKDTLIVTVSENQAKYTAEKYNIPLNLFYTIYNGVDFNKWKPDLKNVARNEIRKKYEIPTDGKLVIMTAMLRPEKNHFMAFEALKIINDTNQNKVYLLLVGSGEMEVQLRNNVNELKLTEYVKFAGLQKDVLSYYQSSDIFALCSNRVETFSIAALEAMACGLPCVLTKIGGADEMIINGENGFLCEVDSESIALNWQKALYGSLDKNRVRELLINKFSHDKMIGNYTKLFNENKV